MSDLLLTGIGLLVTNDPGHDGLLGAVTNAAVAMKSGRVAWVGPEASLLKEFRDLPELDCAGRTVLPGFVDAHTHLVFAGDRSDEFARRLRGEGYEDILAGGGGIQATVAATRVATAAALMAQTTRRAQRMLAMGTTTVEVKSGYGLNVETELRQLEVAASLGDTTRIDVIPTFLGAHVVPPESGDDREAYVDLVINEMLPAAALLSRYCDVFCDDAAFSVHEARRILEAAADHGMRARVHAEQLGHSGGAALAAELAAVSADHLDHATASDMAALAAAGTVAVLLPGVSMSMRTAAPPARAVWDAGVTVAIATDCNPGTAYVENMQLVVALAALESGLTPEEAVWAATRGGALAVEAPDKGIVQPGAVADLVVLDADSYVDLAYRPGTDLVRMVIKDGDVAIS